MRRPLAVPAFALVVFGVLAVAPRAASAQVSIWLQKGVSGFGVAGEVSYSNQASTYGVDGGYSYQGFLDFDVTLAYVSFPTENSFASDERVFAVTPSIQYHPLKQSADIPISLSLGVGYQRLFVSSDTLSAEQVSLDWWSLGLNAAIYRFFRLGSNTGVIPAVGLTFAHTEATATGPGGEITVKSDDLGATIAAYFAYIDADGHIYGLAPSVTIGDHVTVGLQVGVVWSQL